MAHVLVCQMRERRLQETAEPITLSIGLRRQACAAIKRAITEMNIYGHPLEIRLDERRLSQDLGMSRTPVREALSVLEQEGFVRSVPRRGLIVVRKSKREVVEMVTVWAAIEGMAARLAAPRVTDADLAERLVREHTMGLAAHVEQHGDFLDRMASSDDERRRQYA